jgi:hypothetical protein
LYPVNAHDGGRQRAAAFAKGCAAPVARCDARKAARRERKAAAKAAY